MRASLAARAVALVSLVSVVAAGSAGDGAQLDPTALYASAVASGMSGPSTGPPARLAPLPSSFTSPALPSPDPRGGASFTCVTDRDRGTCFVATACELAGATRLGAKHVTLTADVTRTPTRETDAYRAVPDDDCDAFPIVVTSPMTVVGACGGGGDDARCVIDGGGDATRASEDTDVRPSCGPNGARPLFEVGPGGRLTLENVHLSNACNDVDGAGGAVVVRGGDPRGTCVDEGVLESSRNHAVLTVVRSSITRSVAIGAGPGSHGRGGGVALLNKHSLARFTDCTFVDNEAWGGDPGSGAITDYSSSLGNGGGVYVAGGSAVFERCSFGANAAESEGGGVHVSEGGTASFETCDFEGNVVVDDYWDGGGGLFVGGDGSVVDVATSRFAGNKVRAYPDARRRTLTCGGGGAAVVRGARVTFRYVIFENNVAPRGGGVCVHDATAANGLAANSPSSPNELVVFRGNSAAHPWIDQRSPAMNVECVQCFERVDNTSNSMYVVVTEPQRCRYAADGDAIGSSACSAPPAGAVTDGVPNGGGGGGARGETGAPPSEPDTLDVAPMAPPDQSFLDRLRGMSFDPPPGAPGFPAPAVATESSF